MKKISPTHLLVQYFFEKKGWEDKPKNFYRKYNIRYGFHAKYAKDLLELCDNDLLKAQKVIDKINDWGNYCGLYDWNIATCVKRFLEIELKS